LPGGVISTGGESIPLHDRVVVRRLEEKESAKGGIIIPDTAKEKPHEGEVIAIGAGKMEKGHRVPLDVKGGDRILFGKHTGNDIKIDDQEYLILRGNSGASRRNGKNSFRQEVVALIGEPPMLRKVRSPRRVEIHGKTNCNR
jgi:chaperonin GroES